MKSGRRPPATRSNMVRLSRRLAQVERGAALLKKKRESLVTELFARARPMVDNRKAIEDHAQRAYRELLSALAAMGAEQLAAMSWPSRELRVELEPIEVWGLRAVDLTHPPAVLRTIPARASFTATASPSPVLAAEQFERLVELLLEAAPRELLMRRLGQALARTTRLENTLEQRVAVTLVGQIGHMRRTLEEREREEHLRLKRIISKRKRRTKAST